MNLLIEQRPTTITSKLQKQQSNENDLNNSLSSSSSPLILKLKRQTTTQQTALCSNSLLMANEDNKNNNNSNNHTTSSRSTATNQRLKRSIPESPTVRRPSSPAFNGKQQATKRSVTIDNNNNDLTPNIEEISSTKRFKQDNLNHSSSTKVDACVGTISIGTATEPDQLGPCEPGTSVVLEGIVWNETDSGVLVVNVTWRGKTYVGTLLDSTKQDWACPRLICESPTSDYDARNSNKTSRAKRASAGGNHRSSFHQLTSTTLSSGSDDRKLRNNIKSRQSKRTVNLNPIDESNPNSSPLTSPFPTNTTFFPSSNQEAQLIPCSEPQCHKRFVSTIALDYHLSNTHRKTMESIIPQANTRDEEDVAHILANVADYVRRPSPRSSPEHHHPTTLTWPCPQISSNLVLSSSLNNNEQKSIPLPPPPPSTNSTRSILDNNERDEVEPTNHFLLHESSWTNSKSDPMEMEDHKKSFKIPTPPPSTFVPINPAPTIPPTSSSPAYSDISDEDLTITNENDHISLSTINLLSTTNGKNDDNEQSVLSNPSWTTQMLLQQYGSYIQQQAFVNKDLTSNRLNSKTNTNGTSDSTVRNILDSRRLSTTKSSSPSPSSSTTPTITSTDDSQSLLTDFQKTFYHYHTIGISHDSKVAPSIVNSLTSPNENLLNPTDTSNPLDYSLNPTSR